MYQRFRALSIVGRIIVVTIILFVISVVLPLIVALAKALMTLVVAAVMIVSLLWIFDKVRGDKTQS